jgi:hypothetical protein
MSVALIALGRQISQSDPSRTNRGQGSKGLAIKDGLPDGAGDRGDQMVCRDPSAKGGDAMATGVAIDEYLSGLL